MIRFLISLILVVLLMAALWLALGLLPIGYTVKLIIILIVAVILIAWMAKKTGYVDL